MEIKWEVTTMGVLFGGVVIFGSLVMCILIDKSTGYDVSHPLLWAIGVATGLIAMGVAMVIN